MEKGGPQNTVWASWTIHITVLKNEAYILYVKVPTKQCQHDINFFVCFVIIPLGSVMGLVAFGFFFSAAAAAKSLQSCLTLCDPIDGSPPGSTVPGIIQARTLEWVAISFPNAWKWKVKVKTLSPVQLLVTPWTTTYQAPPSMGLSRQEYWSGLPSLQALKSEKNTSDVFRPHSSWYLHCQTLYHNWTWKTEWPTASLQKLHIHLQPLNGLYI